MQYDEIRATLRRHFADLLRTKKEAIAKGGPLNPAELSALRNGRDFAMQAVETGDQIVPTATNEQLLGLFIEKYALPLVAASPAYLQLRAEFPKAYRDYCKRVLAYSASLESYDFDEDEAAPLGPKSAEGLSLRDASRRYVEESKKSGAWAAKTEMERLKHLDLLAEYWGADRDVSRLTVTDADSVHEMLMRYPTNREKRKATRGLSLTDAIANAGEQTLDANSINKYLQTYTGLFNWVKRHGRGENIFTGLAVKKKKQTSEEQRIPFSASQVRQIQKELLDPNSTIVRSAKWPWRKWGTLIGIYTGARVNEISQLELSDIQNEDGIHFFDINDDGDRKSLKTPASKRRIPIHSKLLDLGFLEYVEGVKKQGHTRVFPDFTYSKENKWGRKLSQWFNDVFLKKMGMTDSRLVFHSFRHSAVQLLNSADVQEPITNSVMGHTQIGIGQKAYNKGKFRLAQLKDAIEKLDYSETKSSAAL